jgi:hypothetical protein
MIVVVLGGLSAMAIVGVNSLSDRNGTIDTGAVTGGGTGSSTPTTHAKTNINDTISGIAIAACNASAAAARSASTSFYVGSSGAYPAKWSDLTATNPPAFTLPAGVVINAGNPAQLDGRGWTMTMAGGGATEPSFTCSLASAAPTAAP